MKYILNENTSYFVIIPEYMKHSDIKGMWTNAGFLSFYIDEMNIIKVRCFGESISLKLSVGDEDEEIINSFLQYR